MADKFKQIQVQYFTFAGSGPLLGDSSVILSSFETIDGVPITMSMLGLIAYGTCEPGSGVQEEQISFTGVTQNANGTATLTGVKNVLFEYPYTETANFSKSHVGGAKFILSNTSGYYAKFANRENDEDIDGIWTFTTGNTPLITDQPTTNLMAANKLYVDTQDALRQIAIQFEDQGVALGTPGTVDELDFVGAGVVAGRVGNKITVSISGGGGGGGHIIEENGTPFTDEPALNFINFFSLTDVPGVSTDVDIDTALLAVDPTFITNLTSDSTFQSDVLAFVGGGTTTQAITKAITQAAHGFVVGDIIRSSGSAGAYTKSQANTAANAEVIGIVTAVAGVNDFTVTTEGYFTTGVPAQAAGTIMFLSSSSAGALTTTPPTLAPTVNKPLVTIITNAAIGYFHNYRGQNNQTVPVGVYTNGNASKNSADASTVQNIAHGLGVVPKNVNILAESLGINGATPFLFQATTVYNGTTQSSHSIFNSGTGGTTNGSFTLNSTNAAGTPTQIGVVTFDATNIIITWTKTGSPTGTYNLLWEAQA